MKKAVIVHCWGGYPNYCWYPQTKKELEKNGFEVSLPEMPNTDYPKLEEWLPTLQKEIGEPSKNLYLVGHSLGCITILRYLETLNENEKVDGVVFVAGFGESIGHTEIENFFATPVNYEKIKNTANEFVVITSDNDPYVEIKFAKSLEEKLGAKLIIKEGMKHFSGEIGKPDSCTSLPVVTEELLKMSQ